MKLLIITTDTNDADYVREETKIDSTQEALVRKVAKIISSFKMSENNGSISNWPCSEHIDETPMDIYPDLLEDDMEAFNEFCCGGEYGFHSIERIEIRPIVEGEFLFKRNLPQEAREYRESK